jgi:hypothetical protein
MYLMTVMWMFFLGSSICLMTGKWIYVSGQSIQETNHQGRGKTTKTCARKHTNAEHACTKNAHKQCISQIHITHAQHICKSKVQIPCTPSEHNICIYKYMPKQVQREQQHKQAVHTTNTQQASSKTASIYSINSKYVLSSESTMHSSSVQQTCV